MTSAVTLAFGDRGDSIIRDLSGAARIGDTLFVAGDEGRTIGVMHGSDGEFRLTATHDLKAMLPLPDPGGGEADLEGLAIADGWLWLTGSHALVRKDPGTETGQSGLRTLFEVRRQPNRFVLARLPLVGGAFGHWDMAADDGTRRAEMIEAGKRSSRLMKWVGEDALLAPFTELAAKENGFDVEGIAAGRGCTWLGLRGPVIRGHAIILQMHLSGAKRGALKARKLEGGRRFRTFALDLGGLGVRDLAAEGDDLLILAAPGQMAGGPACVFRWRGAVEAGESMIVPPREVSIAAELPPVGDTDRPEALVVWGEGRALVLHDTPSPARLDRARGLLTGDLIALD